MGTSYYGYPIEDGDEESYYEYEPILTERDPSSQHRGRRTQQQEEPEVGFSPQHLIIFLMGIPLLPIWTAFAIVVTFMKIAYFSIHDPIKAAEQTGLFIAWIVLFILGCLMYMFGIPALHSIAWHIT